MKLRLPLTLLFAVITASQVYADEETIVQQDITAFSRLLEHSTTYSDTHLTGGLYETSSISFDGNSSNSLTFIKRASDTKTPILALGMSGKVKGTTSVTFKNLTGLSFINENTGVKDFGSAVSIEQSSGSGSIDFSQINGDLNVSGFRTDSTPGTIFVRCYTGQASVRFSDIAGNITMTDNRGNDWGLPNFGAVVTAFCDNENAVALVDFSHINGNITFSKNYFAGYGGSIHSFSYEGKASLNFTDINGNISFDDNYGFYGAGICMQASYVEEGYDCSLNFSRINGNVSFTNNQSASAASIIAFGSKISIVFSDITGNVVFQGNKALGSSAEGAEGGAIALVYNTNKDQAGAGLLEFSRIHGDVSFLNNIADSANGSVAGAILIGMDPRGTASQAQLILSADYGNITFSGNIADSTANAIYLSSDTDVLMRAQSGRTVAMYDPMTTDEEFSSRLHINQPSGNTAYNGTVLFSGEKISGDLLGGDASTLNDRIAQSKKTIILGETTLYGGTLAIKNGAVLESETATLNAGTLSTSTGGSLSLTGKEASSATLTILSGTTIRGDITFSGAQSRLNLRAGQEQSSNLRGHMTGLHQVEMTGGNFTRTSGFEKIDQLTLSGGSLNLGSSAMDSLVYEGGNLRLVLSGTTLKNGASTVLDAGTISGNASSLLRGGTGSSLAASVFFDLDSYGSDLAGASFDLVKIGGELQHYDSILLEGATCTSGNGWQTYKKDGLTFDFMFNGTTVQVGNTVKDVISSEPKPSEGNYQEIVKTTVKGELASSDEDPSVLQFISGDGEAKTIGNNIAISGSLSATQNSFTGVTTTISPDGTEMEAARDILGDKLIHLSVQDNVSVATAPGTNSGTLQTDSISIKNGSSVTIANTTLHISTFLTADNNTSLSATGETGRIQIGGGQLENCAVNSSLTPSLCTSKINSSSINLSNGAGLVLTPVTTKGGTALDTKLVISDSTISLGSSNDATGGFLNAGEGANMHLVNTTIQGNGFLNGISIKGGNLIAGHSPGIMNLGNVTISDGAVVQTWITRNLASGSLNTDASSVISQFSVTGNVDLGNASFAVAWDPASMGNTSQLTKGTSFQFFDIQEGGSLNGQFTTLNLPQLNPGLIWDTSKLYTDGLLSIINASMGDGERIASALWSSSKVVSGFAQTAAGHLDDFHASGQRSNVWVSGLGDAFSMGNHNGRTGFDYQGGGYAVGADYRFSPCMTGGLAFGQTFGSHKPSHGTSLYTPGKIEQDSLMMALYGRRNLCEFSKTTKWYIDGYFSYGQVENKSDKMALYDNSAAKAKWHDNVYAAGLKSVWENQLDKKSTLRPFVGIDYVHAAQNDFTESASSISCLYNNGSYQNWSATAGISVDRSYETGNGVLFLPRLTVAYVGDFSRNAPSVEYRDMDSISRKARAVSPGRSALLSAFDLGIRFSDHWGASAGYELEARSGSTIQTFNAAINYSF